MKQMSGCLFVAEVFSHQHDVIIIKNEREKKAHLLFVESRREAVAEMVGRSQRFNSVTTMGQMIRRSLHAARFLTRCIVSPSLHENRLV